MLAGSGGLQALPAEMNRGWKLQSEDGTWTVVIMPDFYALETTRYEDWADFKARLQTLTDAIGEVFEPSIERRLGLRYVDRLSEEEVATPEDWRGRVHDALLGAIAHPELGPGVAASQGIVQLRIDDYVNVLLRHGCALTSDSDDPCIYLLDHDCSREAARPFSSSDVMDGVEGLHTAALQIFQASLTSEYFDQLLKG
jgi:uncharacterized protein (TIGR04255 family)